MRYGCTLIAAQNMERSKEFYRDVPGLEVMADFGANVMLAGSVSDAWKKFITDRPIAPGGNLFGIYFEEDGIHSFTRKLWRLSDIECVHPFMEHPWGQRAVVEI